MPTHAIAEAERQHVAEQFDDFEQQFDASILGMWVFLLTEMLLFGALFTGLTYYGSAYAHGFSAASHHLDLVLGTLNTAVLLTSSFAMVLAVHAARLGRRRMLMGSLAATIVLGCVFLSIKGFEWSQEIHEKLFPGRDFSFHGDAPESQAELFFSFYFTMTGLHALHVTVGLAMIGAMLLGAWRGRFGAAYNTPVDITGLYWHFVDVVWIFLYPILYLRR